MKEETQVTEQRKTELFSASVNYICEELSDLADIRNALLGIGFTESELRQEGYWDDNE